MKILKLKKEWPGEWRIMPFGLDSNLFWLSPKEWPERWWIMWQIIKTPEKVVWCVRVLGFDYKLAFNR